MGRLGAIAAAVSGWWRAWVAALGGANQRMMREAYRDAYEPDKRTGAGDAVDGDGAVEKRVH